LANSQYFRFQEKTAFHNRSVTSRAANRSKNGQRRSRRNATHPSDDHYFRFARYPGACDGGSCAYSLKSGRVNTRVYYAYALRNTKTTTPSVDWSGFQTDHR
jgi:hypothetical protein